MQKYKIYYIIGFFLYLQKTIIMRKHFFILTILIFLFVPVFLTAQVETIYPNKTQTPTPKKIECSSIITWIGPGVVSIKLDNIEHTFQNNQTKNIYGLKPDHGYKLTVVKPDKNYVYEDFLIFNLGNNEITIDLISQDKVIVKTATHIAAEKRAREEAESKVRKTETKTKAEAEAKARTEAEAKARAEAEIKAILKEIENSMVFVQGGTFTMGCTKEQGNDCFEGEKPTHRVTVGDFYIGKFEVIQKYWTAIMAYNPGSFSNCENCPIDNVSWNDVQFFLNKLNQLSGKKYRLPTEAEWEYAARGGNKSKNKKYAGSNSASAVAWTAENSNYLINPAGTKLPNELGLYDMSGNVWEMCSDWYGNFFKQQQTNPKGPIAGNGRVVKGGSYLINASRARVSSRGMTKTDEAEIGNGFRLICDI